MGWALPTTSAWWPPWGGRSQPRKPKETFSSKMAADDSEFMRVRVRNEVNKVDMLFLVKKTISMNILKERYININTSENEIKHPTLFFYKRKLVDDCETPLSIGLTNNDFITAVVDEEVEVDASSQGSTGETTDSEDDKRSQIENDEAVPENQGSPKDENSMSDEKQDKESDSNTDHSESTIRNLKTRLVRVSKVREVEAKDNAEMCKKLKEKSQCVVKLKTTKNDLYLAQKELEAEAKKKTEMEKLLESVKNMAQAEGEAKVAAQRKCYDFEESNQILVEGNAELKRQIEDFKDKLSEKTTENSNLEQAVSKANKALTSISSQLEDRMRETTSLDLKVDKLENEKRSLQQQLDEARKSNTCEQEISRESETNLQQQNMKQANLQLKRKLKKASKTEKSLEGQLEVQKTVITMVRSGIQQVMMNKVDSTSILNALRLIESTTLSSVKEEPQAKMLVNM